MNDRHIQHDVTLKSAPTPDEEGAGMQAIIRAFIRNPVAAGEVFALIFGGATIYYALQNKIDDAKATSEQHYKDLSAELIRSNKSITDELARQNEKLVTRIETLAASDTSELTDIKGLYQRGDTRFATITEKLSSFDVRLARLDDGLTYVVKVIEQRSVAPHDQRGEVGPRMPYAEK